MDKTPESPSEFEVDVNLLESGIRLAENFEELYAILEKAKVIEGSNRTYTCEEIKNLIEPVRETIQNSVREGGEIERINRIPLVHMITNAHKLRDKVIELLEREKSSFNRE